MDSIKILSSYHKSARVIPSQIIIPFWAGKGNRFDEMIMSLEDKEFLEKNTFHGDIGDNMADFAHMYGEIVAIYWMWKNMDKIENPDYVGITHYRRHFDFSYTGKWKTVKSFLEFEKMDDHYIKTCHLNDQYISQSIEGFDAVLPLPIIFPESNKEQFEGSHKEDEFLSGISDVFDKTIQCLIEMYPSFKRTAKQFGSEHKSYLCNMFVMKKELFLEYAEWLFSIIFAMQDKLGLSNNFSPTLRSSKILGFMAERLTSIYFIHLSKNTSLKIKYLPQTFLLNTDIPNSKGIEPAFSENNIPICFAYKVNIGMLPLLLVSLKSLVDNSSESNNYDIIIFGENYSAWEEEGLKEYCNGIISSRKNLNIRFFAFYQLVDSRIVKKMEMLKNVRIYKKNFFSTFGFGAMLRLFIPYFLLSYDKVIYLDLDILVLKDIADLYKTDLAENSIALCLDIPFKGSIFKRKNFLNWYTKYMPGKTYHNAGIMVMGLDNMRKKPVFKDINLLLEDFLKNDYSIHGDQDFLNSYFQDSILKLDLKWNFNNIYPNMANVDQFFSHEELQEFRSAKNDPAIIHFFGPGSKPWNDHIILTKEAKKWWDVASTVNLPSIIGYNHQISIKDWINSFKFKVKKTIRKKHKLKWLIFKLFRKK